jgi:hypothetical protein
LKKGVDGGGRGVAGAGDSVGAGPRELAVGDHGDADGGDAMDELAAGDRPRFGGSAGEPGGGQQAGLDASDARGVGGGRGFGGGGEGRGKERRGEKEKEKLPAGGHAERGNGRRAEGNHENGERHERRRSWWKGAGGKMRGRERGDGEVGA